MSALFESNGKKLEKRVDMYLNKEGLYSLNPVDEQPEPSFSHSGCDICNNGLGNDVFDCHGYNDNTKEIQDGYSVCGECLHYICNGTAYDTSYDDFSEDAAINPENY